VIFGDAATEQAAFEDCCCATCACDNDALDAKYRIASYTDGMFDLTGCSADEFLPFFYTTWDGEVWKTTSCNLVTPNYPNDGMLHPTVGKKANVQITLSLDCAKGVDCAAGSGAWIFTLQARVSGTWTVVWKGAKAWSGGPAGTYTKCSGCVALDQIEIEVKP